MLVNLIEVLKSPTKVSDIFFPSCQQSGVSKITRKPACLKIFPDYLQHIY
jgi:hypothetical protein